jgi:aspartate racemase
MLKPTKVVTHWQLFYKMLVGEMGMSKCQIQQPKIKCTWNLKEIIKMKMKTIGLIGGMSWESTVTYYQIVNQVVKEKLGGLHSAKVILYSVDFQEIEECQVNGEWNKSAEILSIAATILEKAGCDFIVICTNTMHKIAPQIQTKIRIPILHIAEATAQALNEKRIKRVALFGTKYTMKEDFYKEKLIQTGIEVLIPDDKDMDIINHVIYNELCLGIISENSKEEYLRIIDLMRDNGAQGVVLGCTEIGLLIKQNDTELPVFDTTFIHASKAALFAITE